MKLKSNNLRFFKIKWFFSLSLGVTSFLFFTHPIYAASNQFCVPKKDVCYNYSYKIDPSTTDCLGNYGCIFQEINFFNDPKTYHICVSEEHFNNKNSCYYYSKKSECEANQDCEIVTLSLIEVTGNSDPVVTKGNTDPVGYSQKLTNPLGEGTTIHSLIGKAINSLMGIVGALALLMFVYGGLTWMTSSGSQDKVKKGKDIMVWAAVGLIVIFSAYGLVKFIINILTK